MSGESSMHERARSGKKILTGKFERRRHLGELCAVWR